MPASFVKAGLGTAKSSARLPSQVTYLESGTAVTDDSKQALCSDFVSKPVSSPPLPPSQSKQEVTLHCHKLTPESTLLHTGGEKHTSSSGTGGERPSKNLYRGNICCGRLALEIALHRAALSPPAFSECKKNADAWTQREGTMTNVLEPSSCSLEASLSRF